MATALAVSIKGLAQLVERRGKAFAILELVQNSWDADHATEVRVTVEQIARGRVQLIIVDDSPDGFKDLSHAYTLFAPSEKKTQAEKRGRFNLGEKLVIALADSFMVSTTTGTVTIDVKNDLRKESKRQCRESGSEVRAVLRMTKEELEETVQRFRTLIPPPNVATYLNGELLQLRTPIAEFEATLQSEIAGEDQVLRRTERKGQVRIYEPLPGEEASLYELGIPVVETGDRYHVDVLQKVPLTTDRDNVPLAFLKRLRAFVLNATAHLLTPEDTQSIWVTEAIGSPLIQKTAMERVMDQRFGVNRASYDMSDREANRSAIAGGFSIVHGSSLPVEAWENARNFGLVLAAGKMFPSPNQQKRQNVIPQDQWTPEQHRLARAIQQLHVELVGSDIGIVLINSPGCGYYATYGGEELTMNLGECVCDVLHPRTMQTVLHEFAHARGGHLTHDFDSAIAEFASRLVLLALNDPQRFRKLVGA